MGSESDSHSIEFVDRPATFRERLSQYRVPNTSDTLATHRWMGGHLGGTYAIPSDAMHELMQLYIDEVGNDDISAPRLAELPYYTEKLHLPVVCAFCDVDFADARTFADLCEKSGKGVAGVYETIARCYLQTLKDVTRLNDLAEGFSISRTSGKPHKFHLHVPTQLITTGMAKAAAGRLQERLAVLFPEPRGLDWGKIIDPQVYNTGLRFVGSEKPALKAGTVPGQSVYVMLTPTDPDDWSKGFLESPVSSFTTVEELMEFSIRPDPTDPDTEKNLKGMEFEARINNPDEAAKKIAATYAQAPVLLTTSRHSHGGLIQIQGDLSQEDLDALIAELQDIKTRERSPFADYTLDPKKVMYSPDHKSLTVILNDYKCPFKKEEHQRAARGVQYLYLSINKSNNVTMHCWDADTCSGRRHPTKNAPKVTSEAVLKLLTRLRGNAQAKSKAKDDEKKRKRSIMDNSLGYSSRVNAFTKKKRTRLSESVQTEDDDPMPDVDPPPARSKARSPLRLLDEDSEAEEAHDALDESSSTEDNEDEDGAGLNASCSSLNKNFEAMGIAADSDDDMTDVDENAGPWAVRRKELKEMGAKYKLTEDLELAVQEAVDLQVNGSVAALFVAIFGEIMRPDQARYRGSKWYTFQPERHRWIQSDTRPFKLFIVYITYFCEVWRHKKETEGEGGEETFTKDHLDSWTRLVSRLKDTGFQNGSLEQVCQYLYDDSFIEKLNQNPDLVGFENGVLDCSTGEFRDGRPEDYVSYSVGHDFVDLPDDDERVMAVQDFFAQVFIVPEEREYMVHLLAKCLHGRAALGEKFFMFTAAGSNGKTKLISLVRKAFGDYAREADVSLFTQRRAAASGPNPALVQLRGKRFITTNEPNAEDELNIGLMKTLTGGDTISARDLFKSPVEFSIIGAIILTCNSFLAVNSSDKGTWRRLTAIEFKTTFVVGEPDPAIERQLKADLKLDSKLPAMAPALLSILVKTFRQYKDSPLIEPRGVKDATRTLQRASDPLFEFWEQMEKSSTPCTSHDEILAAYSKYVNNNNRKRVDHYILMREVRDRFGDPRGEGGVALYKLKLKEVDDKPKC